LNVQTKFRMDLFALVLFFSSLSVVQGQTTGVSCDSPPGGRIDCERRQAAVCRVSEGKVYGVCSTPRHGMTLDEIRAWILSAIFGKKVTVREVRENQQYQRAINEGRVEAEGARFTFTVPDLIDNPLEPSDPSNPAKPPNSEKPSTPTRTPETVKPTNRNLPSKPLILPKPADKPNGDTKSP
jgi:hypothetical protein